MHENPVSVDSLRRFVARKACSVFGYQYLGHCLTEEIQVAGLNWVGSHGADVYSLDRPSKFRFGDYLSLNTDELRKRPVDRHGGVENAMYNSDM